MECFIDFLARPKTGLFDKIGFDINIFSGPEYYKWNFDSKESNQVRIQDDGLAEFVKSIRKSSLNQSQKAIAFRLGCCGRKELTINDQEKIANFIIREWGGIKHNKPEKIEAAGRAIFMIAKKSDIEAVWRKLNCAFNKFEGISSWSKALSVANPKEFFVYDSRIAIVLRLFWFAFIKENRHNNDCPFLLIKNKATNTLLNECLLRHKVMPWLIPKRYCKPDIRKSYENYCEFIKKLSEKLIGYDKINISDEVVTNVANISQTEECANDIRLTIARQMTEMAIFSLIGNSLDKIENNYGFHRSSNKYIESQETPGFNIENMEQLKFLIDEAHS